MAKVKQNTPLPPIDGIDNADRKFYFDQEIKSLIVWVREGDYYVSSSPYEVISTVLGSCVAVCMRDPEAGVGGMNHFLLPEPVSVNDDLPSFGLRYGSYAIECLVNALLSRGARRERLEVKIFGGADSGMNSENCGERNAEFCLSYLRQENLKVVAKNLRGSSARRLRYYPVSGRAQLKTCANVSLSRLQARQRQIEVAAKELKSSTTIELFDPKISCK